MVSTDDIYGIKNSEHRNWNLNMGATERPLQIPSYKTTERSLFIKSDTPKVVADLSANYTDERFFSPESSTDYETFRILVAVIGKIIYYLGVGR